MRTIALAAVVLAATAAGCFHGSNGTLAFYVKDAPADEYDSIFVEFSKVEVHRGDENGTDGGWATVWEDAAGQAIDLKNFTGDARAFLGDDELEAGTYTQIRIHVSEAWGEKSGQRTDFEVPSGVLKTAKPFDVRENTRTELTVDYDLDRSLVAAGPTTPRFTPVIGQIDVRYVEG